MSENISNIAVYPLSFLFTTLFVLYQKWQFSDDRGLTQGKWHLYGALMRLVTFCGFFINPSLEDILLAGTINILLFELLINKVALNKNWLFVGSTAVFDLKLGKYKWLIMLSFLLISLYIKIKNL